MIFIPASVIINQPINPVVTTTIDYDLCRTIRNSDIKTFQMQPIGTTVSIDLPINNQPFPEIFDEVFFDLKMNNLPKKSFIKKVRIKSIGKHQLKISL